MAGVILAGMKGINSSDEEGALLRDTRGASGVAAAAGPCTTHSHMSVTVPCNALSDCAVRPDTQTVAQLHATRAQLLMQLQ